MYSSIIDTLTFDDVEDLLERAHYALDDLWRNEPPYPKERMRNLMDVIASSVWEHCAAGLKQKNVWKVDYAEAADLLQKNVSLGEKWLATCKQLTEIFWPNYSGNPWRDEVYRPTDLINSVDLLKEVSWSLVYPQTNVIGMPP